MNDLPVGILLIGKNDLFFARARISIQSSKVSGGPLAPPANSPRDDREPSSVTCTCNYLRYKFALAAGTASANKVATLCLFDPIRGGLRCRLRAGIGRQRRCRETKIVGRSVTTAALSRPALKKARPRLEKERACREIFLSLAEVLPAFGQRWRPGELRNHQRMSLLFRERQDWK